MRKFWTFALLGFCLRFFWVFGGAAGLTACADHPYDPDAPAVDPDAPRIHITAPVRGAFAGDVATLVVSGTTTDASHIAQIQVNGVDAKLTGDGAWTATIPVAPGTQLIHAVARDVQGNVGKESRAVVVGAVRPIATPVPRAITAAMSAQTFDAIGRGITGFLTTGDLSAVIAPLNPVIDVGDGPDCNYIQAEITRLSVGSATRVALIAGSGGLGLDAELDRVSVTMHISYAALCADGSSDITVSASHIKVAGLVAIGTAAGGLDVRLANQSVEVTGFHIDFDGGLGSLLDDLHLETALGPIIGRVIELFVVPLLNSQLGSLDDVRTIDLLGTPVDIKVTPARITFDASGAQIVLDAALRAHGDTASPGYVFVANQQPAMSTDRGFALAVADDIANQLLGSYWAAEGMDRTFDLSTGSYGQIGKLYDRVEVSAQVPPFLSATGGSLKLTIGDLIATFKNGDTATTAIAVSAEVNVQVVTGPDGKPRLDVGTPTTYVDVLDENVSGANVLSNAQFEVITSFALSRVIAFGSGSIGAIPLPAVGGVAVRDMAVAEETGYLVVRGNVQ